MQAYETLKVVNGYTIKKFLLGKGSSAETYLCFKQNKPMACKMIVKSLLDIKIMEAAQNEEEQIKIRNYMLKSLKKQINNWKELKHENIVRFLDFTETSNNLYFFLEYCDSKDLGSLIDKRGRLPYKEGVKYLYDIANGIAYLYEKGVYHRDLKPENILIHKGHAKIADFGFSKLMEEAEKKDLPLQQTVVGTPNYMAVQVLQGSKYSIKCDIWSFGVLAYKMFYGILPWNKPKDIEHLKKIIRNPIVFQKNADIPQELQQLLRLMIVPSEQKRISALEAFELIKNMYEKVYGKAMQEEI